MSQLGILPLGSVNPDGTLKVNVNVSISEHATKLSEYNEITITGSTTYPVTVLTLTSTDNNTRISHIVGTGDYFGTWVLKKNGSPIQRRNSTPQESNNVDFIFYEVEKLALGETISLEFTPFRVLDTGCKVASYLQGYLA